MRAKILKIEPHCGTCKHRTPKDKRFCAKHIYYEPPGFQHDFYSNKTICDDYEPKRSDAGKDPG